jgi:serine/threonine protein kinase
VREGDGAAIALKLVRSDRAAEPIALELLAREASALARVASPCVATILEAGLADEDLPFVAMERIEGPSLADVLRAEGRLEGEVLRELVRDLCRGIRDVHDAGVVHRDLKPHNVMRARDADGSAQWKIVDFGLALHGISGGAHTVGGTAAYVAPEQALGERVDPRADLYSACLVVYRALTGRPAFVGDDPQEVALRARSSGPPDPRGLVSLSRELELVLRVGLAADPRDRFATARELSTALTNALDGAISDAHRTRGEALLARAPWAPAR